MGKADKRPWIEVGTCKTTGMMFACPGRHEENAGHPAAGQTGTNLETLLAILRDWGVPRIPTREEATITNAWDGVLHGKTSLPHRSWVEEARNLERIMTETAGISTWLCCFGQPALWAVEALVARSGKQMPWRPVVTHHLGSQGINQIKEDLEGQSIPTQEERPDMTNQTFLRLEVVAAGMLGQMNQLCYVPRGNTDRWQRWLPSWAPARMEADLSR